MNRMIPAAAAFFAAFTLLPAAESGRPFKPYASWEVPLGTQSAVVDYAFDAKSLVAVLDLGQGLDTARWGLQQVDAKWKALFSGAIVLPSGAGKPSILGVAEDVVLIRCQAPWADGGTGTFLATFLLKASKKSESQAQSLGGLLLPPGPTVRYDAALYKDCVEVATRSWDTAAGTATCENTVYDMKLVKILRKLDVSGPDAWTAAMPEAAAPKIRASRALDISEDWDAAKATIQLYK